MVDERWRAAIGREGYAASNIAPEPASSQKRVRRSVATMRSIRGAPKPANGSASARLRPRVAREARQAKASLLSRVTSPAQSLDVSGETTSVILETAAETTEAQYERRALHGWN